MINPDTGIKQTNTITVFTRVFQGENFVEMADYGVAMAGH